MAKDVKFEVRSTHLEVQLFNYSRVTSIILNIFFCSLNMAQFVIFYIFQLVSFISVNKSQNKTKCV